MADKITSDDSLESTPNQAVPLTAKEDKQWAATAHLGGAFGFLPALAIYYFFKNRGPFTAQEAKEAFNFQVPFTLGIVVCVIGMLLVPDQFKSWFALLAVILWLVMTIFAIIGGIRANRGEPYQYPFNLRMFSLDKSS